MNPEEIVDLLSMCAAYDRRTVGEADVHAWHAALEDLRFADARDAVIEHYRESREWLMPADVRRIVRAIRADRMRRTQLPDPPADLDVDNLPAYQQWHSKTLKEIADGTYVAPDPSRELVVRDHGASNEELYRVWGNANLADAEHHATALNRARLERREAERPEIRERRPTDPIDRGVPIPQVMREQMQADIDAAKAKQAKEDAT